MQYIYRHTIGNYTSLNNAFAQDKKLKYGTIGILTVILMNKIDWVVYPEEIARRLDISRTTVDRHLKILEQAGYMVAIKRSLGKGKGSEVHRFFSDIPFSQSHIEQLKDQVRELS